MRIVCPACAAAYDVPPVLLQPAGRVVRCARCGGEWSAVAAAEPEDEAEAAEALVAPPPRPAPALAADLPLGADAPPGARPDPDPAAADPAGRLAPALWLATALILGAGGWAAYAWRANIEAAWPPSQRAYAMLGLS